MDFYKQRRFICEITGHSGLTFFEALQSEVRIRISINTCFRAESNNSSRRQSPENSIALFQMLWRSPFWGEYNFQLFPESIISVRHANCSLHEIIHTNSIFANSWWNFRSMPRHVRLSDWKLIHSRNSSKTFTPESMSPRFWRIIPVCTVSFETRWAFRDNTIQTEA